MIAETLNAFLHKERLDEITFKQLLADSDDSPPIKTKIEDRVDGWPTYYEKSYINDNGNIEILFITPSMDREGDNSRYKKGIKYEEKIELLETKDILNDDTLKPNEKIRLLVFGDVALYCSCPAFLYWGPQYILWNIDAGIEPEDRFPDVRNPGLAGTVCKHLYRVLKVLPFVMMTITHDIRKYLIDKKAPATPDRELKVEPPTEAEITAASIKGAKPSFHLKNFGKEVQRVEPGEELPETEEPLEVPDEEIEKQLDINAKKLKTVDQYLNDWHFNPPGEKEVDDEGFRKESKKINEKWFETITNPEGKSTDVFINPNQKDIIELRKNSVSNEIKGIIDYEAQTLYVFDGYDHLHEDFEKALIPVSDSNCLFDGTVYRDRIQVDMVSSHTMNDNELYPPWLHKYIDWSTMTLEKNKRINEKYYNTFKDGVAVFVNPNSRDVAKLIKMMKQSLRWPYEIRFAADLRNQKVYVWDAYEKIHVDFYKEIIGHIDYEEESTQWISGSGEISNGKIFAIDSDLWADTLLDEVVLPTLETFIETDKYNWIDKYMDTTKLYNNFVDQIDALNQFIASGREPGELKEAYANWVYKVPDNPKDRLFDFYALTYLNINAINDMDLRTALQEAKDAIIDFHLKEFKKSLLFAISAELRHMFDENSKKLLRSWFKNYGNPKFWQYYISGYTQDPDDIVFDLDRIRKSLKDNQSSYKKSYQALVTAMSKTGTTIKEVAYMIANIFDFGGDYGNIRWRTAYGGAAWSGIAKGLIMLIDADNEQDKIIAVDHVYDLQHNTNTVFNKIKSYYGNGYNWIKKALDFKAKLKDIWEIYEKISTQLKGPFAKALKDVEGTTLEDFLNKKEYGTIILKTATKKVSVSPVPSILPNKVYTKYNLIGLNIEYEGVNVTIEEYWDEDYENIILIDPMKDNIRVSTEEVYKMVKSQYPNFTYIEDLSNKQLENLATDAIGDEVLFDGVLMHVVDSIDSDPVSGGKVILMTDTDPEGLFITKEARISFFELVELLSKDVNITAPEPEQNVVGKKEEFKVGDKVILKSLSTKNKMAPSTDSIGKIIAIAHDSKSICVEFENYNTGHNGNGLIDINNGKKIVGKDKACWYVNASEIEKISEPDVQSKEEEEQLSDEDIEDIIKNSMGNIIEYNGILMNVDDYDDDYVFLLSDDEEKRAKLSYGEFLTLSLEQNEKNEIMIKDLLKNPFPTAIEEIEEHCGKNVFIHTPTQQEFNKIVEILIDDYEWGWSEAEIDLGDMFNDYKDNTLIKLDIVNFGKLYIGNKPHWAQNKADNFIISAKEFLSNVEKGKSAKEWKNEYYLIFDDKVVTEDNIQTIKNAIKHHELALEVGQIVDGGTKVIVTIDGSKKNDPDWYDEVNDSLRSYCAHNPSLSGHYVGIVSTNRTMDIASFIKKYEDQILEFWHIHDYSNTIEDKMDAIFATANEMSQGLSGTENYKYDKLAALINWPKVKEKTSGGSSTIKDFVMIYGDDILKQYAKIKNVAHAKEKAIYYTASNLNVDISGYSSQELEDAINIINWDSVRKQKGFKKEYEIGDEITIPNMAKYSSEANKPGVVKNVDVNVVKIDTGSSLVDVDIEDLNEQKKLKKEQKHLSPQELWEWTESLDLSTDTGFIKKNWLQRLYKKEAEGYIDEKLLDLIIKTIYRNLSNFINNVKQFKDYYNNLTNEEEREHFNIWEQTYNITSDIKKDNTDMLFSFYDSGPGIILWDNLMYYAKTNKEKMTALDQFINFAHDRIDYGDEWVEGGRQTLDQLSEKKLKKERAATVDFKTLNKIYRDYEMGLMPDKVDLFKIANDLLYYFDDYLQWYKDYPGSIRWDEGEGKVINDFKANRDELSQAIQKNDTNKLSIAIDNAINQVHIDYPVLAHLYMDIETYFDEKYLDDEGNYLIPKEEFEKNLKAAEQHYDEFYRTFARILKMQGKELPKGRAYNKEKRLA